MTYVHVPQQVLACDEAVLTPVVVQTLLKSIPDEAALMRAGAAGRPQTKIDGLAQALGRVSPRLPYLLNCLRFKVTEPPRLRQSSRGCKLFC